MAISETTGFRLVRTVVVCCMSVGVYSNQTVIHDGIPYVAM